ITVTGAELFEYLKRFPPKELMENPAFQTPEGEFDYQRYLQALADPRVPWDQVEPYVRSNLTLSKLQQSVISLVRVTDEEVRQYYVDDNEKVKVKYLLVPISQFLQKDLAVSDPEIQTYYETHQENFKVDQSANLSYVVFEKKTSEMDEQKTKERLSDIKKEIEEGEDFAELAQEFSDDVASAQDGGNLGWFGKGKMIEAFEKAAFALKPGEMSEPVRSEFGWHLIKVFDQRKKGKEKEIKASHILLKTRISQETQDQLKLGAEEFVDQVKESDLIKVAEEQNLPVSETGWFFKGGYIQGIGTNPEVDEFAFKNKIGKTSEFIETPKGFYVFQIKERRPAGISPLEEVKSVIKRKLSKAKADSLAYAEAQKIYDQIKTGKSLKKAAKDNNVIYKETDEFSRNSFLPEIGRLPEFVGASFSLSPQNRLSPPIKTDRGTFIVEFVSRTTTDDSLFASIKDSLSSVILQNKQSQLYQDWFTQLRESAKIEDHRSEYFREQSVY
ncbi:MAG: peptidylprolyl isomerase, partial [candidate division Zixibacteria bacterium]|nr:peptidylprolyl isomerase [candidate division Zixibacteria bacterium]